MAEDFKTLERELDDNWRYADISWGPYIERTNKIVRAHAGDAWLDFEKQRLRKEGREPINLNLMRRGVSFFSGYWRDNATRPIIAPVENSDQETADIFDELVTNRLDKGGGFSKFNDCVNGAFVAGMNLCGIYLDFQADPVNGDLSYFRRPYNAFLIDPTTEEPDLSDCSFVIMRDFVTRDEAKALLPFIDDEVIESAPSASFGDRKFTRYMPRNFEFSKRDILSYDRYYRRTTSQVEVLVDHQNDVWQELSKLKKDEKKRLKEGIKQLNESEDVDLEIKTINRPHIELVISLSGNVVYQGDDPTGITERYPFVLVPCYFDRQINDFALRVQGIAHGLYDAQRVFNQRHQKILDIFDTAVSSGFKYLIGAVEDTDELLQTGQSRLVGVNGEDGFKLDDVQELQGGNVQLAAGILQYQQTVDKLLVDLTGANETLFGADQGDPTQVSGRIAQVRSANGIRANRQVFDNIEFAQKQLAEITMIGLQKNYSPSKVARVIGREPTEQFYNKNFESYDAQVKQGVMTQSQRDAYYFELVNLAREGIVDIPPEEIINALPVVGKSKLEEAIKAKQQQEQQQQEKLNEIEQLQKEQTIAKTEQDLALAQERRGRMIADLGLFRERISESTENRAQAALARAKTIAELDEMTDDRIRQVFQFVQFLEQQEKAAQEQSQDSTVEDTELLSSQTLKRAEAKDQQFDDVGQQQQPQPGA